MKTCWVWTTVDFQSFPVVFILNIHPQALYCTHNTWTEHAARENLRGVGNRAQFKTDHRASIGLVEGRTVMVDGSTAQDREAELADQHWYAVQTQPHKEFLAHRALEAVAGVDAILAARMTAVAIGNKEHFPHEHLTCASTAELSTVALIRLHQVACQAC